MMEEIFESELPGVGKKYTVRLEDATLTVILHEDGRREMVYEPPEGEPVILTLSDELARKLALILAGAYFTPAPLEAIGSVLSGRVRLEWVRTGSAAGRTLGELDVRNRTGASVIAVARGDRVVPNPGADFRLEQGDVLIAAGREEELRKLRELVE